MPTDAVSHHPPIDETPRPESVGEIALDDAYGAIARNTAGAFVGVALVIGGLLAFDWALEWLRGDVRW
ncbi:MAG: hypothetical protein AAGB93_00695 [Planctomycetota bacterium]